MVNPSPWPILTSLSLFNLTSSTVLYLQGILFYVYVLILTILILILSMFFWFRDIITEATYLGCHTLAVQKGITLGVGLFIVSETLFFLAVFWGYFHSALSPTIELGAQWPPKGIEPVNAFELPLLNTIILLASGVTITFCHHAVIRGVRNSALIGGTFTLALACVFSVLQIIEYKACSFSISDGVFGSCFFFATGFHGIHVVIGTIFLAIAFFRIVGYHLTGDHHLGLESGILYWHFVDIVWLFLFVNLYWWGS